MPWSPPSLPTCGSHRTLNSTLFSAWILFYMPWEVTGSLLQGWDMIRWTFSEDHSHWHLETVLEGGKTATEDQGQDKDGWTREPVMELDRSKHIWRLFSRWMGYVWGRSKCQSWGNRKSRMTSSFPVEQQGRHWCRLLRWETLWWEQVWWVKALCWAYEFWDIRHPHGDVTKQF